MATSTANVSARAGGNGATLLSGEKTEILAGGNNTSESFADGVAIGGLAGIGVMTSTATASGTTHAAVNSGTSIFGAALDVIATAGDFANAESEAAAGGFLGGVAGSIAFATHQSQHLRELR